MRNLPEPPDSRGGAAPGAPPILVAGVGNIFLRDDGFGPEVARRLACGPGSDRPGLRVVDYGIRGLHLAYDLLEGAAALVLVDALPPSGAADDAPGSIRVLEIRSEDLHPGTGTGHGRTLDPHGMDPAVVLEKLQSMGGRLPLTYLVGCVVADTQDGIGLSAPVQAAVPTAVSAVLGLVADRIPAALRAGSHGSPTSGSAAGNLPAGNLPAQ